VNASRNSTDVHSKPSDPCKHGVVEDYCEKCWLANEMALDERIVEDDYPEPFVYYYEDMDR
jgi:hypothetical protein